MFKTNINAKSTFLRTCHVLNYIFPCLSHGHSNTLLTFNNTNINVMKYRLLFHHSFFFFFSLYLMGHILILLRSACLCAVLIFSSSLMHCCIIYIPQYNKPPLPSTDTKPYFTRSHSPWRDRKDRSCSQCCRFVGNGKTSWMPHPDTPSMAQAV